MRFLSIQLSAVQLTKKAGIQCTQRFRINSNSTGQSRKKAFVAFEKMKRPAQTDPFIRKRRKYRNNSTVLVRGKHVLNIDVVVVYYWACISKTQLGAKRERGEEVTRHCDVQKLQSNKAKRKEKDENKNCNIKVQKRIPCTPLLTHLHKPNNRTQQKIEEQSSSKKGELKVTRSVNGYTRLVNAIDSNTNKWRKSHRQNNMLCMKKYNQILHKNCRCIKFVCRLYTIRWSD